MITFTANHSDADLEKWIQEDMKAWFDELMEKYKKEGRRYVDAARRKTKAEKGFGNITWNLRESIGMVLVYDGQIVDRYFPPIGKGAEGAREGLGFAEEMALLMNEGDGIQMIIVAGMDYASYVESKGWDVISQSGNKFKNDLKAILR